MQDIKYKIWGFEWITSYHGNPIPERLIIAALDEDTNELSTFAYDKQEVELFICSLDVHLHYKDLNTEIIKQLLNYYNLKW